jgi:hypothetical protein
MDSISIERGACMLRQRISWQRKLQRSSAHQLQHDISFSFLATHCSAAHRHTRVLCAHAHAHARTYAHTQTYTHTPTHYTAPFEQLGVPAPLCGADLLVQHGLHSCIHLILPDHHGLWVVRHIFSITQASNISGALLCAANKLAAAITAAKAAHWLVAVAFKVVVKCELLACGAITAHSTWARS